MKPADAKSAAVSAQSQPFLTDKKEPLSASDLKAVSAASESLQGKENPPESGSLKNRAVKQEEGRGLASIKDGKVAFEIEGKKQVENAENEVDINAGTERAALDKVEGSLTSSEEEKMPIQTNSLEEEEPPLSTEGEEKKDAQAGGLEEKEEPVAEELAPAEQEKTEEPPKEEAVEAKEEEAESKVENEPVEGGSEDSLSLDSPAVEDNEENASVDQEIGSHAAPTIQKTDRPDRFNEIQEILVEKLKEHIDELKSQEKEETRKERAQEAIVKDQKQREVIKEAIRTFLVRSLQSQVELKETLKVTEWTKDQIEELAEQTANIFFEGHSSYFSYLLNKELTGVLPHSD